MVLQMNRLLVIPGHLGKDPGAPINTHISDTHLALQEERFANLQQAAGFVLGYVAHRDANPDDVKDLSIDLCLPEGLEFYDTVLPVVRGPEYFSINSRIDIVNSLGADVIEVHNNAVPFEARGAEALCFSKISRSGDVTWGYLLAEAMLSELTKVSGFRNRGVKPIYDRSLGRFIGRKLPILYKTRGAAIITESGFLSNVQEAAKLDVDLDYFNEQVGYLLWRGFYKAWKRKTA